MDRASFTIKIYDMMVKRERGLRADELAFLDRGFPDAFAFYRHAGMDPNEVVLDCFQNRYATVFMLDRLPYQKDGIRAGDDTSAHYYDSWMVRDYIAIGYNVVKVPVLPPEERLAFVLEILSSQGLNLPLD